MGKKKGKRDFVNIVPYNNCGKKTYSCEQSANNKLRAIQNDHKTEKKPIRAYYCSKCNGWHLTHKPKMGEGPRQVPLDSYNPRWAALIKGTD